MLRGIRRECPQLHVKAFTAIEIVHFTRVARLSIRDVLTALRDAGLGSLPGGGAEIFDDRVHDEVFKGKVRADRWFDVHRTAHGLGIYSNATMLYGHVETVAERVRHMIALRELQAESLEAMAEARRHEGTKARSEMQVTDGTPPPSSIPCLRASVPPCLPPTACFNCVIPLSFIPENSELGHLPGNTGLSDLKTLPIARLMIPNTAHAKPSWILQAGHWSQV